MSNTKTCENCTMEIDNGDHNHNHRFCASCRMAVVHECECGLFYDELELESEVVLAGGEHGVCDCGEYLPGGTSGAWA